MTLFQFIYAMNFKITFATFWFCCLLPINTVVSQSEITYDLVIEGGRVIDPETKLDAIANVGIRGHKIMVITQEALKGINTIDADGLVVSPGFIDLHVHGVTNVEQEYQVMDGVTTALELEWGIPNLKQWFEFRNSKALINFGASVNWPYYRAQALKNRIYPEADPQLLSENVGKTIEKISNTFQEELSQDEQKIMLSFLNSSLKEGGIGLGIPVGYINGATREEIYRIYQFASNKNSLIFSHIRSGKAMAVQQALADAILSGASLHLVHINSMALDEIALAIEMIQTAKQKGFDISTELYPYTAASTGIESAIFDPGWQDRLNISYSDVQWVATGERLNETSFNTYRKQGGTAIIHMMKPEWIEEGLKSENIIIASDGMGYAKLAHPRTAGTYSRVLGKYVREDAILTLNTAIKKMTLLPAQRLEKVAPAMRYKGRIQVGSDADITIFNAKSIIDKATFENGLEFSEGVEFVIVNGKLLVQNGVILENTFPGEAIYGKDKI